MKVRLTVTRWPLPPQSGQVTEDVPADGLAIARCRQTTKEGWARKRRKGG